MIRLFVALQIPSEIIDQVFEQCKKAISNANKYRWEKKESIHLTIKFIGEVDPGYLNNIKDELQFLKSFDKISCSISQTGFFFSDGLPSILWAGLNTESHLFKIAEELNKRLEQFNIPIEKRKFKPHITLMRIKDQPYTELLNTFNDFKFHKINFTFDSIALIKSDLHPSGAQYTEIQKYKLR